MPQYTITLRYMRAQAEPFGAYPREEVRQVQAEIEPFDIDRWRAGDDALLRAVKSAALELGVPEDIAHSAGVAAACGDYFARHYKDPAYTWSDPELSVRF